MHIHNSHLVNFIKFKVHGNSIMEFPDWVQVKEKTLYPVLDTFRLLKINNFKKARKEVQCFSFNLNPVWKFYN